MYKYLSIVNWLGEDDKSMESAAHNLGVPTLPRCEFSKGFQCWLIVRFVQQLWMKSERVLERAQQAE